jgi:hypothetical protein
MISVQTVRWVFKIILKILKKTIPCGRSKEKINKKGESQNNERKRTRSKEIRGEPLRKRK